jgi:hypothetical protein
MKLLTKFVNFHTLFWTGLLCLSLFTSCSANAAESEGAIIIEHHLAEYCVAVIGVTADPAHGPASEWLSSIADFDDLIADKFYTQLLMLVEIGDLDPADIKAAAGECSDAHKTMVEEQNK